MIDIQFFNTVNFAHLTQQQIKQIVSKLIEQEDADADGEIRIIIVDDSTIHSLNRTYLEHDYPTDVIAFTLEKKNSYLEGEVYVSLDRAKEQALYYNIPVMEEVWRLIIHGTLHLMGYNDQTEEQRHNMREKEDTYLHSFQLKRKEK